MDVEVRNELIEQKEILKYQKEENEKREAMLHFLRGRNPHLNEQELLSFLKIHLEQLRNEEDHQVIR